MTNQDIQITRDEGAALAGALAPSSRRPAGVSLGTVINFKFQKPVVAAASMALEDASSLDTFESLGELAVRIVGQFKLPRVNVLARE